MSDKGCDVICECPGPFCEDDNYDLLYGDLLPEWNVVRPATEDTIAELRAHSVRHRGQVRRGEGVRYSLAHAIASAGLWIAAKGHELLDAADKDRGYR